MERTIADLNPQPDYLLFDGSESVNLPIKQEATIDGDAKIMTIAAASIIAKVYRDLLMATYDEQFPGYNFSKHVGYGTAAHIAALKELGICPIHRKSYKPVKKLNNQP
jgi:ribonuclease HII